MLEDSLSLGFLSTHTERFLLLQFLRKGEREEGEREEGRGRGMKGEREGGGERRESCSATHRSTPSCIHLQGPVSVSCVNDRDCLGVNHPDVCSLGLGITLWALPCTLTLQPLVNTAEEQEEESPQVSSMKKGLASTVQFLIAYSVVGRLRNKATF